MVIILIVFIAISAYVIYDSQKVYKYNLKKFQEKELELKKANDNSYFYFSLFRKACAMNKYKRKDFETILMDTYDYLPVRQGNSNGFWENIFAQYNLSATYNSGDLDEKVIKELADAMWLSYDQEMQKLKTPSL